MLNIIKPYISATLVVTQSLPPTPTLYRHTYTYKDTRAAAYARTHGKPLTGQIMEGNVFHFGLFEKAGTIFP